VALTSATETDALSTALLTLGPEQEQVIKNLRPDIRTLVIYNRAGADEFCASSQGITLQPEVIISTKPQLRVGESN
jgi:thiamine biosynthesis lipoprotein ApbE